MAKSKKFREKAKLVDFTKKYPLGEAVQLAQTTSYAGFDATVELHVRIKGKTAASGPQGRQARGEESQVRGTIELPHGTGKKLSVEILNEEKVKRIADSGKADSDIYLATPALMPKVAQIAKILGPKGKMPNPKSGTVVEDAQGAKKKLESGSVIEYRSDPTGIVHLGIGKVSWPVESLVENAKAIIAVLPKNKIFSIAVSATMGPGIKVAL